MPEAGSPRLCVPCSIGEHENCDGQAYVSDNPQRPQRESDGKWMRCQCPHKRSGD